MPKKAGTASCDARPRLAHVALTPSQGFGQCRQEGGHRVLDDARTKGLQDPVHVGFTHPPKRDNVRLAKGDPPSLYQLVNLARRLDETERQTLITMAKTLLRK